MSGPIVPPLEVTEVDGNPSGRPITKIIVSNGDLSISGRTATIDTSGSGGTPGGADTQVQYNNSGAFGGSADFTFTGIGGTDPTLTITNSASDAATITQKTITFDGGTDLPTITTTTGDDGLLIHTGTHGSSGPRIQLDAVTTPSVLSLTNDESDGTINIETTAGTGEIKAQANGDLKLYGDSDSVILRHQSGGSVYATSATDEDAILGITSVGTGTPRLDVQSPSNRVWALCDENKKLKIQGGSGGNTFIIDVSGAATGITFPDGTTQTTAASGGGIGGSITDNQIAFGATAADDIEGEDQLTWDSANDTLQIGLGVGYPRLKLAGNNGFVYFANSDDPPVTSASVGLVGSTFYIKTPNPADTERLRISNAGSWGIEGANYGTSGQVLTSGGSGAAISWEDAALSTTAHSTPPANASDTGTAGQMAYDDDYLYVCISTDTWKRTALSTW